MGILLTCIVCIPGRYPSMSFDSPIVCHNDIWSSRSIASLLGTESNPPPSSSLALFLNLGFVPSYNTTLSIKEREDHSRITIIAPPHLYFSWKSESISWRQMKISPVWKFQTSIRSSRLLSFEASLSAKQIPACVSLPSHPAICIISHLLKSIFVQDLSIHVKCCY